MKGKMTKKEKNWLRIWQSVVGNPEDMKFALSLTGFTQSNKTNTTYIMDNRVIVEGSPEETPKTVDFLVQNFERLLKLGIVFCGDHVAMYPWRYGDSRVNIPFRLVQDMLRAEYGEDVEKKEIKDWMKLGFLPTSDNLGLPLFARDRIMLIRELRKRFGYTDSQMKQLMKCEDKLMEDLSILGVYEDYLKKAERSLQQAGEQAEKYLQDSMNSYFKIPASDPPPMIVTPPEGQDDLSKSQLPGITWLDEHQAADYEAVLEVVSRHVQILFAREKLLQGYSPQISFKIPNYLPALGINRMESIDWVQTLENVRSYELDFVRTPDFMLENNKSEIIIRILNPAEVETNTWKQLGQMYSDFRKKIGVNRLAWGERSSKKAKIDYRDMKLREGYDELKKKVPSAERRFEILQDELEKETKVHISIERLKRIVYQKK